MLAVSTYAWWRGGWVERVVAVANVLAWVATAALQNRTNWVDPQWSGAHLKVCALKHA